jgi:transposase
MRYIGIDVSMETLDVFYEKSSFVVNKNKRGHQQLLRYLKKGDVIGLEATNTYHYEITNFLLSKGFEVRQISSLLSYRYQHIDGTKQTNDKSAAKALVELLALGKGRSFTQEQVNNPLRELTRARDGLIKQRGSLKCRLHKEANKDLQKSYTKLIKSFDEQIEKIEEKMLFFTPTGVDLLEEIPGVSKISARIILAELGNINRFQNYRQIVNFVGYDPSSAESGTSVNKRGKLSKRGSPYLRRILHLGAFANMNAKPNVFNAYYQKKKTEGKHHNAALTATARKMLQVIYALLKKNEPFSQSSKKTQTEKII